MSKYILAMSVFVILSLLFFSSANAHDAPKPDGHAPIGVMGDHLHKQGQWMVGYRFKSTSTKGLRNGNNDVSNDTVLAAFGEAATKTTMDMHMFELMYGVSNDLTLMVMPQFMEMSMLHQSRHGGGHSHRHEVSSFGDTEVTGLYSLFHNERQKAHLNFGMSVPTGETNAKFNDHHGTRYNMPYNMQFGSGTFDPIIGATYTGTGDEWSWGAQTINYMRVLGQNNQGYRQGSKFTATSWVARNVTDWASVSLRLDGEAWGDVKGRDATLPATTIAGAQPDQQAGERVFANVGVNLLADDSMGALAGHRLAAEFGMPIYERYSSPQPATDYRFTLSWQKAF
mgnify:CR=1 FL=1